MKFGMTQLCTTSKDLHHDTESFAFCKIRIWVFSLPLFMLSDTLKLQNEAQEVNCWWGKFLKNN